MKIALGILIVIAVSALAAHLVGSLVRVGGSDEEEDEDFV